MDATQCWAIAVLHIPSVLPTDLKQRIRDLPPPRSLIKSNSFSTASSTSSVSSSMMKLPWFRFSFFAKRQSGLLSAIGRLSIVWPLPTTGRARSAGCRRRSSPIAHPIGSDAAFGHPSVAA
jgi:hypothetical protein